MATETIRIDITGNAESSLKKIARGLDDVQKESNDTRISLGGLRDALTGVGGAIAGAFAVNRIVTTAATIEDLRGAFNSLNPNIQTANAEFERVRQLSIDLGANANVLAETYVKLAGAGIRPTNELLTTFVDTSKNATDQIGALEAIADAFSRTTAGGMGLDNLERLADRGIPVFKILEQQLGLTRDKVTEYGKSTAGAAKIQQALITGLNARFAGTAVRELDSINSRLAQSETLFAKFQENIVNAFRQSQTGKDLETTLFNIANSLATLSANTGALSTTIDALTGLGKAALATYAAFKLFTNGTAIGIVALNQNIATLYTGIATASGVLGPFVSIFLRFAGIAALIWGVAEAVKALITYFGGTEEQLKTVNKILKITLSLMAGIFVGQIIAAIPAFVTALNGVITAYRGLSIATKAAALAQAFMISLSGPAGLLIVAGAVGATALAYNQLGKYLDDNSIKMKGLIEDHKNLTGFIGENGKAYEGFRMKGSMGLPRDLKGFKDQYGKQIILPGQLPPVPTLPTLDTKKSDKEKKATVDFEEISQNTKAAMEELARPAQELAKRNAEISAEYKKQIKDLEDQRVYYKDQLSLIGLSGDALENRTIQLQKDQAIRVANLEYEKQLIDLEARRAELSAEQYSQEERRIAKLRDLAIQSANERAAGEQKVADATRQSERTDVGAWARKRGEELMRALDPVMMIDQAFSSVMNNMGNAIDRFVETGKLSFGDLARSILADIAKIALKAAVSGIFGSLFGGGMGIMGGLFGRRAAGGPVQPNKPYLVGENGPEIFVPGSMGSVLTNASMNKNVDSASMQPIQNITNNYYNISAIDAQSVAQFFMQNRKTVYAANVMARKELPY